MVCIKCGALGCACDMVDDCGGWEKRPSHDVFFREAQTKDANINGQWVNPYIQKEDKWLAQTIYIGDDVATSQMKVLFNEQDFINLIEEYMGRDVRNYLESLIRHQKELIAIEKQEEWESGYTEGFKDGRNAD